MSISYIKFQEFYMNTSMEFDNCDDEEIRSDNIFKRAIEEAIATQRPISVGEYNAFMNSIGALVPGFVIRSLPKLLFSNLSDSVRATTQAIDFIKSHPSLPVSFNIKKGVQILHAYLMRQETFLALQQVQPDSSLFSNESWGKFKNASLADPAVTLAKVGQVQLVNVLLSRHFEDIRQALHAQGLNIVNGIVAHIPIVADEEEKLVGMLGKVVIPHLVELEELAVLLVTRAKIVGETDPDLAKRLLLTVTNVSLETPEGLTPMEALRIQILKSESKQVRAIVEPVSRLLDILIRATADFSIQIDDAFNLGSLEQNEKDCLMQLGARVLQEELSAESWQIRRFTALCAEFNLDANVLISRQIKSIRDAIVGGRKRAKGGAGPGEDADLTHTLDVLHNLIDALTDVPTRCECIYQVLIAVGSLHLSPAETSRIEEVARAAVAEVSDSCFAESVQLLKSYVSVLSVQKILTQYPQFEYIRDRPDFLMKRDNVMAIVAELSTGDGLNDVRLLAETFPYIDVDECVLMRLSSLFWHLKQAAAAAAASGQVEGGVHAPVICGDAMSVACDQITQAIAGGSQRVLDAFVAMILTEPMDGLTIELITHILDAGRFPVTPSLAHAFAKLRLLLVDFGTSASIDDLSATDRWTEISSFQSLLSQPISVEDEAKLERARLLFHIVQDPEESGVAESLLAEFETLKKSGKSLSRNRLVEFMARVSDAVLTLPNDCAYIASLIEDVVVPLQALLAVTDDSTCDHEGYGWTSRVPQVETVMEGDWRKGFDSAVTEGFSVSTDGLDEICLLAAIGANPDLITTTSDYATLERIYRLRSFGERGWDAIRGPQEMQICDDSTSSSTGGDNCLLANRAKWAAVLTSFSVPFQREVLFNTIDVSVPDQKRNTKTILNEVFPELLRKSHFDLQLAESFGTDFGRSVNDVHIKWLEMVLAEADFASAHSGAAETVLDGLLRGGDRGVEYARKLSTYILPTLVRNERVAWLVAGVVARVDAVHATEWKRLHSISCLISALSQRVDVSFHQVVYGNGAKVVTELITHSMADADLVTSLVELGNVALGPQVVCEFALKMAEKITAYPDLLVTGQVGCNGLIALLAVLEEGVTTKALRRLIQAVPVSEQQLDLVHAFQRECADGISDADVILLRNRLVLKKFGVSQIVQERIKELNFSIRRVIEFIYFNLDSIERGHVLVSELADLNSVDLGKLRSEITKKWLMDDVEGLVRISGKKDDKLSLINSMLAGQAGENSDPIITVLLKVYFSAKATVANKLIAFDVLFSQFGKSDIVKVYHNSLDDLVGIQKQLTYLHLLSETHKVLKPMEYKDFVALDKTLVVKNLVNSGNAQHVLLAVFVVIDFAVTDHELIEKLEGRIKVSFGVNGFRLVKKLRGLTAPVSTSAVCPDSSKRGLIAQVHGDENAINN